MRFDQTLDKLKKSINAVPMTGDIVDLIKEDHKPLKEFIKVMKDLEKPLEERQQVAEEFAIHLVAHAKPEEQVLYEFMKKSQELRAEALEGETEHVLADQLLEEIKRTTEKEEWSAKVKVLAELVEHHIDEEESELLPDFKKETDEILRTRLGNQFLQEKVKMLEMGADDAPPESTIDVH